MKPLGPHKKYKNPKKILLAAADVLAPRGRWAQFRWISLPKGHKWRGTDNRTLALEESNAGCAFCLEGAVAACSRDKASYEEAILVLRDQLAKDGYVDSFQGGIAPSRYNDIPSRTKKQVINLLKRAAS